MKLIDFAFKTHFSPAFLPEIPPGKFLFHPEISNFTLRQFLHETKIVAILIYKHCIFCFGLKRYKFSINEDDAYLCTSSYILYVRSA